MYSASHEFGNETEIYTSTSKAAWEHSYKQAVRAKGKDSSRQVTTVVILYHYHNLITIDRDSNSSTIAQL